VTLNVWSFYPGLAVRVVKTFRDLSGTEVAEGTILHFKKRDYLPYHSGHTVYFEEVTLCLCDLDESRAIVENVGHEFFELIQGS
jgi:hypothetical protein